MTFDSAKPLVVEIGLGCYFWLALCTLLSGALYPALEVGTACQIPLTLSCDAGLLLGFAGCLAVAQSGGRTFGASSLAGTDRTSGAVVLPFLLACTTSASILLRAGMLFEDAAVPMIAGDVLLGASLAAAGYLWWLAFSGRTAARRVPSARARAARRQHRLCRAQPHAARHSAALRLLGGARRHGSGTGGRSSRKPKRAAARLILEPAKTRPP